jgi:hypothetical protein
MNGKKRRSSQVKVYVPDANGEMKRDESRESDLRNRRSSGEAGPNVVAYLSELIRVPEAELCGISYREAKRRIYEVKRKQFKAAKRRV